MFNLLCVTETLFDFPVAICVFYWTVLFSLLTCFLLATTRWGCHEKLGLLSFRANAESFSCSYRLQVRSSVAAYRNSKVFKYKFVAIQKFSKKINAKQNLNAL